MDFVSDTVVRTDPGRTKYPTESGRPEWRDDNLDGVIEDKQAADGTPLEWSVPATVVRNTKPVVTAKFKVMNLGSAPQANAPKELTIQGIWQGSTGGMACPAKVVSADVGKGGYITHSSETNLPVPDYVDSVRQAGIVWQYQIQGDVTNWYWAGSSTTELFVTLAQPQGTVYHTDISLSTRVSTYATTQAEVVNDTFDVFKTRAVSAVAPAYCPEDSMSALVYNSARQPLHYYLDWNTPYYSPDDLVYVGDGQCGAWASLFVDAVQMHGAIPATETKLSSAEVADDGFAVASWQFQQPGKFPNTTYPFVNFAESDGVGSQQDASGSWHYVWRADYNRDATDLDGACGQNVCNPRSLFKWHWMVSYSSDDKT